MTPTMSSTPAVTIVGKTSPRNIRAIRVAMETGGAKTLTRCSRSGRRVRSGTCFPIFATAVDINDFPLASESYKALNCNGRAK
jgi:hypothetical protein